MNAAEQAAFDLLVVELDKALEGLGQPAVRDHPAFSIAPKLPGWPWVTASTNHAAELELTIEGGWVRVDIAGFAEALVMPLPGNDSAAARRHPPLVENLARLLVSSVTLEFRGRRRHLFMTDAHGRVWGRNRYLGHDAKTPPRQSREYSPLCDPPQ